MVKQSTKASKHVAEHAPKLGDSEHDSCVRSVPPELLSPNGALCQV